MKKFGCIAPSVVQLPWDFCSLLPAHVKVNVATLNVRNGLPGEFEWALEASSRAADVLIDEGVEAIVVLGVPIAARRGFEAERAALNALTAKRESVPITSSLAASISALQHLGVRNPLFITQYSDEVNAQITRFSQDAGLNPVSVVGLQAGNAAQVNALSVSDYAALAADALERYSNADGIFVAARGNLLDLCLELEASIDLPVVEQMQATAWWALSRLDEIPPSGTGRLFSRSSYR